MPFLLPTDEEKAPFQAVKAALTAHRVLVFFDKSRHLCIDGWSLNGVEILDILVWDVLSDGECLTTQPRILTAAKCATRVAEEMGVVLGGKVGVKTRTVALVSANTHLGFVTDGILLRTIVSDRALSKYGCVIIDEAHERGINVDLILVLLKKTLTLRKDLKVGGGTRCGCPGGSQADTRRRS